MRMIDTAEKTSYQSPTIDHALFSTKYSERDTNVKKQNIRKLSSYSFQTHIKETGCEQVPFSSTGNGFEDSETAEEEFVKAIFNSPFWPEVYIRLTNSMRLQFHTGKQLDSYMGREFQTYRKAKIPVWPLLMR